MSTANFREFWRFFHWGPIIAISIIKIVTLMTLYMNSMWWPPNLSVGGFLNQSIFLFLSSMSAFNYIMATVTGPGFLPKGWKPKDKKATELLQFCKVCEGYKAPRSHHCRKCDRCVKKMDHHCPWINNCVGWSNHAYFTYFLGFSVVGCIQASFILVISFYRGIHRSWYIYNGLPHLATVQFGLISLIFCIFSLGLAVGVVIAVGMLLYFQIRAIVNNRTGIEDWILEKANYRRENSEEKFLFPYDLGRRKNVQQVMNFTCAAIGDGISWAVADTCDQYTLTREQIAQKAEKRARTKTYKIIRLATGSYVPLFSQGFKVCLSTPCTDEARIKLAVGDTVKVTRWRKHWLFGERAPGERDQNGSTTKLIQPKGWFPRRCAVELIDIDSDEQSNQFDDNYEDEGDSVLRSKKIN